MNTQSNPQAAPDHQASADLGYLQQVSALNQGAAVCRLEQFKLLRVSGADAATYLQGQLSNDIRLLNGSNAQYTCHSSAKGRMLATFLCWKSENDYFLIVPSDLSEVVAKRLSMFILRSKVKLTVEDHIRLLGINSHDMEMVLTDLGYTLPNEALEMTRHRDGGVCVRMPGGWVLLAAETGAVDGLTAALPSSTAIVSAEAWSLLDISAGIPWLTAATQEQFVAQMANMDLIGAVSFTKGCYSGQEIIARTRYLGKTKRRAYRLQFNSGAVSGDLLYSPEMEEQAVGMIVNVARDDSGQYQALAVIQSSSLAGGIYLDRAKTIQVKILSLPYSLVDE